MVVQPSSRVVQAAVLTLQASGVGHRYATYAVPRVTLSGVVPELPQGTARRLIKQALAEARENRYLLFSEEVDAP